MKIKREAGTLLVLLNNYEFVITSGTVNFPSPLRLVKSLQAVAQSRFFNEILTKKLTLNQRNSVMPGQKP
ncbi:hypothetical protein ES703_56777 [subsurface metagenome]